MMYGQSVRNRYAEVHTVRDDRGTQKPVMSDILVETDRFVRMPPVYQNDIDVEIADIMSDYMLKAVKLLRPVSTGRYARLWKKCLAGSHLL
jgi:hypothetical protein